MTSHGPLPPICHRIPAQMPRGTQQYGPWHQGITCWAQMETWASMCIGSHCVMALWMGGWCIWWCRRARRALRTCPGVVAPLSAVGMGQGFGGGVTFLLSCSVPLRRPLCIITPWRNSSCPSDALGRGINGFMRCYSHCWSPWEPHTTRSCQQVDLLNLAITPLACTLHIVHYSITKGVVHLRLYSLFYLYLHIYFFLFTVILIFCFPLDSLYLWIKQYMKACLFLFYISRNFFNWPHLHI